MSIATGLFRSLGIDGVDQTPFSLRVDDDVVRWTERADGLFEGPSGLVARLRLAVVGEGVEISGSVTNEGSAEVGPITSLSTASLRVRASSAREGTLVRTWTGVRFLANFYPPDDFEEHERLLVATPQVHSPLAIHGGADGRGSSADLPFLMVDAARANLAIAVAWSGTWMITVRQANPLAFEHVDIEAGIWGLETRLAPGASIELPPVLLLPFQGDGDSGSNALRRHILNHVTPSLGGEPVVPFTSFNSWFAFENEYSDALLRPAVDAAAAVGLEYFVVDGGWYTGGFREGIGNWERPDPQKFPAGFEDFSAYVRGRGMKFGTWLEPEFARIGSEIERAHPDWFRDGPPVSPYSTPRNWQYGRPETGYRMLDFGLADVQEFWVDYIGRMYREWHVRWIRWDFNQQPRPHWDLAADPGRAQLDHLAGLYTVLDHVIAEFPDLVIEQCASGGHRIDLALAARGHTFWMNDHTTHTDLVRRMQARLNRVLPSNYANTNLCQPRHDFTEYDFLSHMGGSFGYSGRLWEASLGEQADLAEAVRRFKEYRPVLLGDFDTELDDASDPLAPERQRWTEGARAVEYRFNGELGARGAAVSW